LNSFAKPWEPDRYLKAFPHDAGLYKNRDSLSNDDSQGRIEMKKEEVKARIEEIGIIPSVRTSSAESARFAAESVSRGGIPIVEITMTVPGAVEVISYLLEHIPGMIVGAGSVLNTEMARRCLDAGAHFLTTEGLDLELVQFAVKQEVVVFPGTLTPTEVITAWKAGADFVKVVPCAQVGGATYIRALKSPLPQIRLIAAGGVNQVTAFDFVTSGATALGVGRELIPREAVRLRQADRIQELARRFAAFVIAGRAQTEARNDPNYLQG
jgi:2-dehydro-3-deoxyphosphogluconate aldolase/(4S)-4-hydroxy-2-oxoglutarate aldolase